MNLLKVLRNRQSGQWSPYKAETSILDAQYSGFQLSQTVEFDQDNHTASVTSVAIDSDAEQYLLAGLGDGTLCIHRIRAKLKESGYGYQSKVDWRAGKTHPGKHKHGVKTVSWFTDNGIFLSSGRDGKLKVWDTNAGSVVEEFKFEEGINHHSLADPAVGPLVAVASKSRNVVLADMHSGAACHTLRGHTGEVFTLAWHPGESRILATGSRDHKIMLWDVRQSKSYLCTLDYNNVRFKRSKDLKLSGESHQGGIHGLEFSSCGRYLYSCGGDRRIRKWDVLTKKNMKTKFPELSTKHDGHTDMKNITGGQVDLLFVPELHNISVFHTTTGALLSGLVGHYSTVYTLAYSARDTVLYSGGRDRFILGWDPPIQISAAEASKYVDVDAKGKSNKQLKQYTVDTWSSDEDQENENEET